MSPEKIRLKEASRVGLKVVFATPAIGNMVASGKYYISFKESWEKLDELS